MNHKHIPHPSAFIEQDWQQQIRQTAAEAEHMGKLHPKQLELIYRQKWFKALMPTAYGGLDLTIPQLVRLQEGLSWADGSFGWVFTLCCGAGWFAGFIDPELATDLFAGEQTCLAGSGASTGEAVILPDGYLLNGVWNYASGAYHATHFTANCIIKNGGETVLNPDGSPLILPFIIDKKEVELLDTWKYVGMVATGSNSFKIENVKVDKTRCFKIDADAVTLQSKLYKYPFRQLAEATLAANIMGMAIHFVDLAEEIIRQRTELGKFTEAQQIFLNNKLANAKTEINIIRERFYKAVDESWELNIQPALNQVSITSRKLAQTARLHVDDLYSYCGLMAASPDTEINRVWRDVHTASQHTLLTFES